MSKPLEESIKPACVSRRNYVRVVYIRPERTLSRRRLVCSRRKIIVYEQRTLSLCQHPLLIRTQEHYDYIKRHSGTNQQNAEPVADAAILQRRLAPSSRQTKGRRVCRGPTEAASTRTQSRGRALDGSASAPTASHADRMQALLSLGFTEIFVVVVLCSDCFSRVGGVAFRVEELGP